MKKIYITLAIFFASLTIADAAPRVSSSQNSSTQLVKQYADSLAIYKQMLDSVMNANDSLRQANGYAADNKYFRYFAPMAFYPDVTGSLLRMDNNDADTVDNKTLMGIYLQHPEYVNFSASHFAQLEKGPKFDGPNSHAPERIELTKQINPQPAPPPTNDVPEEAIDLYYTKPHFWTFSGDYYMQFMQNYVSENWYKSGSNSYSMLGTATLQYNYNNKQKVKWDNKLELKLGFQTSEADTVNKFKTSEDLIRYTSKFGLQAHEKWYYTAQLIAYTQFARGYKNNDDYVYSDFMSPFNLNISLGMDYTIATKNKKLTGSVHIAPIAFNFKYVGREYLAESFGIENGHHTLEDFGSQYTIEMEWKPVTNLKWKTRIYGYTTYHKYEMEWENTITMQFNKYITTNLFIYPRFDDSVARVGDHSYFQFKEYLSFGFTYSM